MYDIIIIGAGPAGLTAAVYARRAEKKVLVLEAKSCGGQIVNTPEIDNYPAEPHISGFDFATRLYEQAKELGAEIVFEKAAEIKDGGREKTVVTTKNSYTAGAVIIACGSENRKLGIENEDELVGKGVSYCATCDGAFYRKKAVAVVGGGNTALEDALYLSDLAEKVYLIHRRQGFRADETTVKQLTERENVEFVLDSVVTKLNAEKRLNSVEVKNTVTGETRVLEVKGIFAAVGRVPENQNFAKLITLDGAGYIEAGENCRTNVPGTKEVRQLVTAAADGAVAVNEAVKYLRTNS